MTPKIFLFAVSVLLACCCPIFAQTNDEGLAFLQFNFLNPGARALAMGGAFVAMADDATASVANPAGLTALTKMEAGVEYSISSYENRIPWADGRIQTDIEAIPVTDDIFAIRSSNPIFFLEPQNFPATIRDLSFASFVYPVMPGRFVVSGFYNRQTKFERDFHTTGVDFILVNPALNPSPLIQDNIFATKNSLELDLTNIGFAASVQPITRASFGIAVTYSQFDVQSFTERFPLDATNKNIERLEGDDTGITFTAGLLLRLDPINFGASYTRRPEFDATATYQATNLFDPTQPLEQVSQRQFKFPDSFTAGVSLQPTDYFSLNLDVVRVLYSQLMDNYYNAFFLQGGIAINREEFQRDFLEMEDGTEYRVGAEYVLPVKDFQFSLRAGYWREPFHSVVFNLDDADLEALSLGPFFVSDNYIEPFHLRSYKKDTNHITFGGGIALKQVSIDAGIDYSDTFSRFVVSTVVNLANVFQR